MNTDDLKAAARNDGSSGHYEAFSAFCWLFGGQRSPQSRRQWQQQKQFQQRSFEKAAPAYLPAQTNKLHRLGAGEEAYYLNRSTNGTDISFMSFLLAL